MRKNNVGEQKMIPVSVIITTLNEAKNLARCLEAVKHFDEIIVVDSGSTDETVKIAQKFGVRVERFEWNGQYPKKRQWCLDSLNIKYDFVFWVDGDEQVSPMLMTEIYQLDFSAAGYFVRGIYAGEEGYLFHGLQNNKLALFNRHKIKFPVVNDLDIDGMGEIEGHYQPVLKPSFQSDKILQLKEPVFHYAYEDDEAWQGRHARYALWEAGMIARDAYPKDPNKSRELLKSLFRKMPLRGVIAFCHSYFLKSGYKDGRDGLKFAKSRYDYYTMVATELKRVLKTNKGAEQSAVIDK